MWSGVTPSQATDMGFPVQMRAKRRTCVSHSPDDLTARNCLPGAHTGRCDHVRIQRVQGSATTHGGMHENAHVPKVLVIIRLMNPSRACGGYRRIVARCQVDALVYPAPSRTVF